MEDTDYIANENIRWHNEDIFKRLNTGDLVKFDRGLYEHWVVYIGDEEGVQSVIHSPTGNFSVPNDGECMTCIKIDPLLEVAGTSRAEIGNKRDIEDGIIDGRKVVERAKAIKDRIEKDKISGLFDNSEHFAKWCRYGHLAQIKSVEEIANVKDLFAFVRDPRTNNITANDKIREHNTQLLHTLKEGDLIKFSRTFYYHWAVYIGKHDEIENAIIHWSSSTSSIPSTKGASIKIASFWEAANGDKAEKGNYNESRTIDGSYVVRRAKVRQRLVTKERIINEKYNIIFNNCQHFATWCRYGPDEFCEEEDFNIEDPNTSAAIEGLKTKWYTDVLEVKEEVKQLRIEVKNLQQGIKRRDYTLFALVALCFLSIYRGSK